MPAQDNILRSQGNIRDHDKDSDDNADDTDF